MGAAGSQHNGPLRATKSEVPRIVSRATSKRT